MRDLAGTADQALLTLSIRPQATAVVFSPDGVPSGLGLRLAAGMSDGTVKLWEVPASLSPGEQAGKETLTLLGHTDQVQGLAFSPDGKALVTASLDGTAKVWNTATGQEVFTLAVTLGGSMALPTAKTGRAWPPPAWTGR